MELRVVGHTVLPAAPDDVDPGSREDAHRVRMALAAAGGPTIDVGCPVVAEAAVRGEVGERIAQFLVAGVAGRGPAKLR
jgi:hypothetical protein